MERLFLFIVLLFSIQVNAQRNTSNNGMIDVKLVAADSQTGEIIPFVVFQIEMNNEELGFKSTEAGKNIPYFSICPQKALNNTIIVTAYRKSCDSVRQELFIANTKDTTLYFNIIKNPDLPLIRKEHMLFVDSFHPFFLRTKPNYTLAEETIIHYEHCDGRIAEFDSIPEKEMLAGAWSNATIPDQLIARCPSGECEWGDSVTYITPIGDTVIPYGRAVYVGYDHFLNYGIIAQLDSNGRSNLVGIDTKGEYIFDVYIFDNGPDYTVEGRFRIKKDGKIGFANEKGEIVIEPQFECAGYFEDGKAKVTYNCTLVPEGEYHFMQSETWFYIDQDGIIVE